MEQIKGVNLGNWLVLEKWMSSELFYNLPEDVEDEMAFYEELSQEEAENRLFMHRSYYIQERDFQHIKKLGLNLVRIPVPYFIFGDCGQGVGCIEFLDKAFDWAEKYGLKILIDLHTAPDSQNGFDNGGLSGVIKWHKKPENIEFELSVIERLAKRYAGRKALYGIELLNEPVSAELLEMLNGRYKARHPEQAEGSEPIPLELLKEFYVEGYNRVRKYCDEDVAVVLHDNFNLELWDEFMPKDTYENVVIDTHMYLFMLEQQMQDKAIKNYEEMIAKDFGARLARAQKYHPVIVGEWCIANKSNEVRNAETEEEKAPFYRQIGKWELKAWKNCSGWIFWNYKLHTAGRNDWDYARAIDGEWLVQE